MEFLEFFEYEWNSIGGRPRETKPPIRDPAFHPLARRKNSRGPLQTNCSRKYPRAARKLKQIETAILPNDSGNFENIINDAYKAFENEDVVNLVKLEDQRWVLELFHGPTLAFKDVAMQLLGTLLNYFAQKQKTKIAVLGATSGDTGSAAISACSRYENVEVFILYPHERVTDIQRKQMTTTQAKNVHALSIQTDFDGCQAMVKELFLDNKNE